MSLKRKFVYGIFLSLALISCILVSLWFFIPLYLNSDYFLQIVRDAGINEFSWDVHRAGITGTDIGSLQIGPDERKSLVVQSVQVDYSLKGLCNKEIKSVTISGLEFYCGVKDGHFAIRGFDLQAAIKRFQSEKTPQSASADTSLPAYFGSLKVRNAVIVFEWEEEQFRIPVEFQLIPKQNNILHGILKAFLRTQEIAAVFDLDLPAKKISLEVNADAVHIERFSDLTGRIPELAVSGKLDAGGKAEIHLEPFGFSSIHAFCEFRNKETRYSNIKLQTFHEGQKPFRLDIRSEDGKAWNISASSASLVSPVGFRVSHVKALLRQTPEDLECSGNIMFELEKSGEDHPASFEVITPLVLKGNFSGEFSKNGDWNFKFTNKLSDINPSTGCNVKIGNIDISANIPGVEITAQGKSDGVTAIYDLEIPNIEAAEGSSMLQIPVLSLSGDVGFDKSGATRATIKLGTRNASAKSDSLTVKIPEIILTGKIGHHKEGALHFDGTLNVAEGEVRESESKTEIKGIQASFPFQWPWKKTENRGKVSVASMQWGKFNIGSLKGFIQQNESGVIFGGKHYNKLLPGLNLNLSGKSMFLSKENRTEIKFDSLYKITSATALRNLLPAVKGMELSGVMKLNGELVSDAAGLRCGVNTILDNANLRMKEKDINIENLRIKLSLPDILKLRSAPRQPLTVGAISFGDIRVSDVNIEFQVEPERFLFIEKGGFKWCDGNVSTQALRITPEVQDYDLILYCDRLNLSKVLMQLGVARAEGDGAVSGRIPLRFKDGKFIFNDGFLFSTPGEGGVIHVTSAEMLTAGIPENTPQFSQIELAREALKDYIYKWVRLRLTTEGENLMLRIKFDGKPANPLPFVYNEEFGGFVRVQSGKELSNFQGIRLNVNLGVPLNKFLRYKGVLDTINNN